MTDVTIFDEQRLRKLLGGAELAALRRRLRTRYERGAKSNEFTLTDLDSNERRTLDGLLGRRTTVANTMRLRGSDLDSALERAGVAATLRAALEFLDGPLVDLRAARSMREREWRDALSRPIEARLQGFLQSTTGIVLLKRLAGGDVQRATALLEAAERVFTRLPARGLARAQLAAEVLGDSHALDGGQPVAALVLRAAATHSESANVDDEIAPITEESARERWARLGITINPLALPVLTLNLVPEAEAGEPVHLSLRLLLRRRPSWHVEGRAIYVCENPNIVAIAADTLGSACAPLICTDGMPAAAQQTLLTQLRAASATLRYHGDFDWPGVKIGNFVTREFDAHPWRFSAIDYLAAAGSFPLGAPHGIAAEARWDNTLAAAMAHRQVAIHEEAVVDSLLRDLSAGGTG